MVLHARKAAKGSAEYTTGNRLEADSILLLNVNSRGRGYIL